MNNRFSATATGLILFSPLLLATTVKEEKQSDKKKPLNILYIMSDDHAYQMISAYDTRHIKTPNKIGRASCRERVYVLL